MDRHEVDIRLGDYDIELLLLNDILCNLPALEVIDVEVDRWSYHDLDEMPGLYQRLRADTCGALPDADFEPGPHSFADRSRSAKQALVASYSLRQPIKRLLISGGGWEHIMAFEPQGKHFAILRPLISGLVGLALIAHFSGEQRAPAFLMKNLGAVLNMATSLTELNLGFITNRSRVAFHEGRWSRKSYDSILELLDSASPDSRKSDWGRKLRHITLDGLQCRRREFMRLMKRVSASLRGLTLSDFTLIPDGGWQQKSCLVSVLEDIRSATNLDKVYLGGNFTNCGAQEWAIGDEDSAPGCHQELTEDWILGKTDSCPIELLRIVPPAYDFTQKQYDALPEWDDSWTVLDNYLDHTQGADIPSEDDDDDDDDDEEEEDDDDDGYGYGYGFGHGDEDGDDSESDSDQGIFTFSNPAAMIPNSVVLPFVETAIGIAVPGRHPTHTNYDWLAEDVD